MKIKSYVEACRNHGRERSILRSRNLVATDDLSCPPITVTNVISRLCRATLLRGRRTSFSSVLSLLLAAAFLLPSPTLMAQSAEDESRDDRQHVEKIKDRDEVDKAIEKGIRWLVSKQDPTEGYFKGKMKNTYTALSCIALMAAGHLPGHSEFGDNLRRGILYLVKASEDENGYFGKEGQARMYGHGMCTLALLEAYGMMQTETENMKVKGVAEAAIKVILRAQNNEKRKRNHFGGWRYKPKSNDADLSLTVWQILPLRSAENCQLDLPGEAVSNAITYVENTYNSKAGGFAYQPGKKPSISMRCAGVVSLLALGAANEDKNTERIEKSARFLLDFDPAQGGKWFYYQSYYVATAANMAGKKYREAVLPRMEKHLLSLQKEDGSFEKFKGYDGGVYSTAFSVICLAVRYQYLPIYQE
ncbi:MAG: prenyltransferase/squalene oxidase repeat-containing protein [Kiritimatiellia bacterium]